MAETVMPTVVVRRFDWTEFAAAERASMIELVRSLGLDPYFIAIDFAISRVGERPWKLHLSELQHDEQGQIVLDVAADRPDTRIRVFDDVALPAFLTAEEAPNA